MKIIAGLGNPGPKYETTRHNAGFLALDRMIDKWNASGPSLKYQGEIYEASVHHEKVCLVKPQTFMNLSGRCIGQLFHFFRCQPEDLIVIHDELDLPPLTLRLKTGGGAGGHNGLKSIDEALGKERTGYFRMRIGVGHPVTLAKAALTAEAGDRLSRLSPADYVLQPFTDAELVSLDPLLDEVTSAAELILKGQIQTAMTQYHRSK